MSEKETLLADAANTVRQRDGQYGKTYDDFSRISALWNILNLDFEVPHHVAMFMVCVKLSRLCESPGNRDSWLDIAGYAGCGWECAVQEAKSD